MRNVIAQLCLQCLSCSIIVSPLFVRQILVLERAPALGKGAIRVRLEARSAFRFKSVFGFNRVELEASAVFAFNCITLGDRGSGGDSPKCKFIGQPAKRQSIVRPSQIGTPHHWQPAASRYACVARSNPARRFFWMPRRLHFPCARLESYPARTRARSVSWPQPRRRRDIPSPIRTTPTLAADALMATFGIGLQWAALVEAKEIPSFLAVRAGLHPQPRSAIGIDVPTRVGFFTEPTGVIGWRPTHWKRW